MHEGEQKGFLGDYCRNCLVDIAARRCDDVMRCCLSVYQGYAPLFRRLWRNRSLCEHLTQVMALPSMHRRSGAARFSATLLLNPRKEAVVPPTSVAGAPMSDCYLTCHHDTSRDRSLEALRVRTAAQTTLGRPSSGEQWRVRGELRQHPKWGWQIDAESAIRTMPSGRLITAFLAAHAPGVAPEARVARARPSHGRFRCSSIT